MDTNIVHESMGLTSPGLYFMWRKRLLVTNGIWDGGWARRGEDESPVCILFHFEEARVSIFYFRVRAFFLANDWDNLSGIEFFFGFPWVPWSAGPSGLLEQSWGNCDWPPSPHGVQASALFALLWICADGSGHVLIHRWWAWDRVCWLCGSIVFGGGWSHPLADMSRSY